PHGNPVVSRGRRTSSVLGRNVSMLLSTKIVISSRSTGLSAVAASIMGPYITQAARVRIVRPEAQTLSLAHRPLTLFPRPPPPRPPDRRRHRAGGEGACPCGVVFQRWVTPEDAELNLLRLMSLN